jgi:hypothetical protein
MCASAGFTTWALGTIDSFLWVAQPDQVDEKYMSMGGVGVITVSDLRWPSVDGLPFKVPHNGVLSSNFQVILNLKPSTLKLDTPNIKPWPQKNPQPSTLICVTLSVSRCFFHTRRELFGLTTLDALPNSRQTRFRPSRKQQSSGNKPTTGIGLLLLALVCS